MREVRRPVPNSLIMLVLNFRAVRRVSYLYVAIVSYNTLLAQLPK